MEYAIDVYQTRDNKLPFNVWLLDLADILARQKIRTRLDRVTVGNFGDYRNDVAPGVHELRIDFGPGYRVYFTLIAKNKVLILCGGTKKSQQRDIGRAQLYLQDFLKRGMYGKKQKV